MEGPSENIDFLRKLATIVRDASQWYALVKVKFHAYGKYSYEAHRFYYPNDTLKGIIDLIQSSSFGYRNE